MAEKQYYTGITYSNDGARLIVVDEPVKNSIKCKCALCGAVDTYRLSDLRENKVVACKACKQGIEIGDNVGGLEVQKFTVHDNKLKAIMHCSSCNKNLIHEIGLIKSKGYRCPVCIKVKKVMPVTTKMVPTAKAKKEAAKKNLLGNIVSFDGTPSIDFSKYGMRGDFIFTGRLTRASKDGATVREVLRGQCTHCGGTTTESENYFVKHEYKCQKCSKINKDRRNIIENTNWVGYVRHNIEITKTKKDSNGVLIADTRCLACGHEMTIPVVTIFSEPALTCINCGDTPIVVECPLCHKSHIKTTLRKLYDRREAGKSDSSLTKQGVFCGKEVVEYSEILLQHETVMGLERIRKKYKGYTLDERIPGHDETPVIFKFKEGYIGTDGERYHTCMCEVHNKMMVLTDDEIRTYKHEYCADTRMMPYNPNGKPKKRQ